MDGEKDDGPGEGEYRIETLAAITGMTVRNIREFQDKNLLAPPRRIGRVAYYGNEHVVRLRLILRLRARGYAIAGIRDLLEAWAAGHDLDRVLGLETVVSQPWIHETPETVTRADLKARFGAEYAEEHVEKAVAIGILQPVGHDRFDVPSPALLTAGLDLVSSGIPMRTVLEVISDVQTSLDEPADRLIGMVWDHIFPQDPTAALPRGDEVERVSATIALLRPHALRAVDTLFAGSMVRAINRRYQQVTDRVAAREKPEA